MYEPKTLAVTGVSLTLIDQLAMVGVAIIGITIAVVAIRLSWRARKTIGE